MNFRVGNLCKMQWLGFVACNLWYTAQLSVQTAARSCCDQAQASELLACRQLRFFWDLWQALSGRSRLVAVWELQLQNCDSEWGCVPGCGQLWEVPQADCATSSNGQRPLAVRPPSQCCYLHSAQLRLTVEVCTSFNLDLYPNACN